METILVVDDETPVRALARDILLGAGYWVLEADVPIRAAVKWVLRRRRRPTKRRRTRRGTPSRLRKNSTFEAGVR
jgi:hypothetical protein